MPDVPWFVYAMLLAPFGFILLGAVYKMLQVRAAREWPSTPGKVLTSNSQMREVRVLDDSREDGHRLEQRNFANIVYEYSVSAPDCATIASVWRRPRQFPGRRDHRASPGRHHGDRLLQSAASARGGAGARFATGPVGLSHANLSSNLASTSSWLVRKLTTAYPDGARVNVYVNPANPSEATLNPRASFVWLLWPIVPAMFALAYYAANHG